MTIADIATADLDTVVQTDAERIFASSNVASIPPLADHWKKLDLREILSRPAAFLSVSQSNSLYKPGGVQYGERHDLRGSLPVGRVVLRRKLVFAPGRFQLVLRLELFRPVEMGARRGELRTLERDLEVRVVGRGLRRRAVIRHRLIEIARLRRGVSLPVRLPCRAAGRQRDGCRQCPKLQTSSHSSPESIIDCRPVTPAL